MEKQPKEKNENQKSPFEEKEVPIDSLLEQMKDKELGEQIDSGQAKQDRQDDGLSPEKPAEEPSEEEPSQVEAKLNEIKEDSQPSGGQNNSETQSDAAEEQLNIVYSEAVKRLDELIKVHRAKKST